jgi:hypothetical protein
MVNFTGALYPKLSMAGYSNWPWVFAWIHTPIHPLGDPSSMAVQPISLANQMRVREVGNRIMHSSAEASGGPVIKTAGLRSSQKANMG